MRILRDIRDYFVTDIEVTLTLDEGAEYRFKESSTAGGAALTRLTTETEMRIIFHGRFGLPGRGTSVTFVIKGGCEMTVWRKPFGRIEIVTTLPEQPGFWTLRHEYTLFIGEQRAFRDSYGNLGTIRRFRHRDFVLFPSQEAKS